jgi:hypothetical protein
MKRSLSPTLLLLCATLLGGCEGASPSPPGNATLTVTLATPNQGDRSLLVTLNGPSAPASVAAANPAYVVYSRSSGNLTRVAVFGAFKDGPLLTLSVPDAAQAGAWTATVTEAADAANAVRASVAGYQLTVAR